MPITSEKKTIKLYILGRKRDCYYTGNINKPWWSFFKSDAIVTTAEGDITYIGEIKDNKIIGKGKMIFKNGDVYEGNFVNGLLNGKGKKIFKNGDVYEGNFVNGLLNGKGKRTYTNGAILKGNYKDDIYIEDKEIRERHNELCIALIAAHDRDNKDKQQYQSLKKYEKTINAKYNYKGSDNLGILVKHDEISGDYNNKVIDRDLLKDKIEKIESKIDSQIRENNNKNFKVLKIHIHEHGGENQTYKKEITPFVEEVLKIAKEKGIKKILITNSSCHGATKDPTLPEIFDEWHRTQPSRQYSQQTLEGICANVFKGEKDVNIFIKKNNEKKLNYSSSKQYKNQKDNIPFLKHIWANNKAVIKKFDLFVNEFKKSNKKNIHKMYDKARQEIQNERFLLNLNSTAKNNGVTRW